MINNNRQSAIILIAEDDDDDFFLTQEALEEVQLLNPIRRVCDGEELMDYLLRRGAFEVLKGQKMPSLILLDLNMPKKDGKEALAEIKTYEQLRKIPVVVLTTSKAQEDVITSYELGTNSFIRKPVKFQDLIDALQIFKKYWLELVELPE